MEDVCCYTLAIRQRTCQNGISKVTDNVFTDVAINSVIPLAFGYTLTALAKSCSHITIQISNPDFIPTLIFNIPCGSFKVFDLPKESGCIRIFIGATITCCGKSSSYC